MSLFARRQHSCPSSECRISRARSAERQGRRARWRARPEADALDSRLLMASANPGMTDATASADLSSRVAQVLEPYFDQDQIPGISVAIVTDGQVALAQGYGVSNVKTRAPVAADTRFDIGSVTKTFTAIGVMLLYQESQGTSHPLDLNAPISEYLHNNKNFKLPAKWSHITTMELLDMTSGIQNIGSARPWQAQVATIAKDPLLFAQGTQSLYRNTNYYLLGQLIEQWTGEKYGTFIQNQILEPLGLSQTEVLGSSATVSSQAVGYDAPRHGKWPKAAVQNGQEMYAAAGIVSTADDMATYMKALLSGSLLDPATYALMWSTTPTPQFGANQPSNAIRGLGWDTVIDSAAGPEEVIKGGRVPGFTSDLILYPGSDSGIFVSFNSSSTAVSAMQVANSVYEATQSGPQTGG
jgi:D-alanyl-D-alanine carboxypeptidase